MGDTFGGRTWTRPDSNGRGRSQRELQDRASYDQQDPDGCSLFLILAIAAVAALLGVVFG